MTAHLLDRYLSDLDPQHLPVAIRAASRYARTDPTPEDVLDTEYGEDGWPAGVASVVSLMGVQALEERTTQCYGDITDAQRRVLWEEYEKRDRSLRDPCDQFTDWQANIRAIALALEALRKVDRYGVTKTGEQYKGWKQLPPAGGSTVTMTAQGAAELLKREAGAAPVAKAGVDTILADRGVAEAVHREARRRPTPPGIGCSATPSPYPSPPGSARESSKPPHPPPIAKT